MAAADGRIISDAEENMFRKVSSLVSLLILAGTEIDKDDE